MSREAALPPAAVNGSDRGHPLTSPKRMIVEETVSRCVPLFRGRLHAIILTGSVARNEGTVVIGRDGDVMPGDAEFLLVFDDHVQRSPDTDLKLIADKIHQRLAQRGLHVLVSLDGVPLRYFRGVPPSIFGYELRTWGEVVWGKATPLELIPRFTEADIPLEDGWRLLANRLVEQLEGYEELVAGATTLSAALHYRTVKLYLDMATSLLVFLGHYCPTYEERAQRLKNLLAGPTGSEGIPFPLDAFAEDVLACTQWKLFGGSSRADVPRAFWERAIGWAEALWHWELTRLLATVSTSSEQLMEQWMRRQRPVARLRGWSYVARKRRWHRSLPQWPRWVRGAMVASPRYVTYAAAVPVLFAIARVGKDGVSASERHRLVTLCRRLPVADGIGRGPHVDTRRLAEAALRSYKEFLVGTRA